MNNQIVDVTMTEPSLNSAITRILADDLLVCSGMIFDINPQLRYWSILTDKLRNICLKRRFLHISNFRARTNLNLTTISTRILYKKRIIRKGLIQLI